MCVHHDCIELRSGFQIDAYLFFPRVCNVTTVVVVFVLVMVVMVLKVVSDGDGWMAIN